MRKMTVMGLALAMGTMSGPIALAQPAAMVPAAGVPGAELQTGVFINVAQVKDDLFAGTDKFAKGASEVTDINLDPKTMGMVSGGDKGLASKMHFMVIHEYKYDKPGMYKMDEVQAYRKKLEDGSWSCSVHVQKETESTDICTRTHPEGGGSEMVILEAKPLQLTFIHMSGNMSLGDLEGMGGDAARGASRIGRRMTPHDDVPPPPPTPPSH